MTGTLSGIMHNFLHTFIVFLLAAVIVVPVFRAFKVGAILAYLFAGVLIGPQVSGLVEDTPTILSFSELGVVFLLFLIGLELRPQRLWRMRTNIIGLGLSQVVITGGLFTVIAILFKIPAETAFIAGYGLALSSTAFSLQILEERRQLKTLHGQSSFSILLFQDLAVVPLIAIVPLLASKGSPEFSWLSFLKPVAVIFLLVIVGLYFIRYLFRFIAESRVQEVFTAVSLLVVVGSALLMEQVGLSMGTGAFIAGVLLANSEYRHELESNLKPFKGLLLGLFFIAVGMALDLRVLVSQPLLILSIVVTFMFLKALVIYILGRTMSLPYETSRNMAFTLPQGGEFAFVLFAAAFTQGLLSSELNAILSAAVTLSMALTPLLFSLNQKYLRSYSEVSERPNENVSDESSKVIIAGYGRFGQIVARFLQTQSISFTILEHSAAQVDTARKYGTKIFYGDASRKDIVDAAGAGSAEVFVLAIDDPEASIRTAKMIKENFPHLKIIARVRNRQHAIDLLSMGIENVHRETYLTSLEVAKEVLIEMKGLRPKINKKLALFRTHDEKILRQQLAHREDEKGMINFTNLANLELDLLLKADGESIYEVDEDQSGPL